MNALVQQDFYLNSGQYSDMKRDVRQNDEGANKAALQQFESLFITQMLKEMRSAAIVDEEQHSSYMDFYTDMYDKQLATIMAKQGGIGIADQLEEQLAVDANINHKKDYTGGKFFPLTPSVAVEKGMPLNGKDKGMEFSSEAASARELKLPFNLDAIAKKQSAEKVEPMKATQMSVTEHFLASNKELLNTPSAAIAHKAMDNSDPVALPEEFHQIQNKVDNSVVTLTALNTKPAGKAALTDEKIHFHQGWSKPSQFIQELMPHAQTVAKQLGVKPEIIVAQSALETGWGKHTIRHEDGSVAFSLFGIKADHRWSGDTVQVPTLEFKNGHMQQEMAHFRAYDSVGEAVQDYVHFIKGSTRYQNALEHKGDDAHYVKGLQKAGYATDPKYANKILNILNGTTLKQGLASIESHREVA